MEWIIIIAVIYLFLLLGLAFEARTMRPLHLKKVSKDPPTSFSIVINYRNERDHLPRLLFSIAALNYDFSKIEFIFINDQSTDDSASIIAQFKSPDDRLSFTMMDRIPASASAKKDGISQALKIARYDHIITTDADCQLPINWLQCYDAHFKNHPQTHFLAAPVFIATNKSLLQTLQSHEMVALQVITKGAFQIKRPFMCNGANMGFTKKAFEKVQGYKGNTHISSGDDIFLLEKLWQRDSEHCHYLNNRDATVTTFPKESWGEMISQRVRWAQKGSETSSLLNKVISFQVLATSLLVISVVFLYAFACIAIEVFIGITILKLLTDFLVLYIGKAFFNHKNWLRYFPVQFLIYPFVIIAVAVKSLSKPTWRGRKINQAGELP